MPATTSVELHLHLWCLAADPPSDAMLEMSCYLEWCCAGFVLVVVMKPLSKQLVVTVLPLVYKVVPVDLRKLWQPPLHSLKPPKHEGIPVDESGQSWDVSVTARFISYASIGWTVVDFAPFMFQVLGLSIPSKLS